jgi:hypothetical protein
LVDDAGCRACFFNGEFSGGAFIGVIGAIGFIGFIAFLGFICGIGIIDAGRDSPRLIGRSDSWRGGSTGRDGGCGRVGPQAHRHGASWQRRHIVRFE